MCWLQQGAEVSPSGCPDEDCRQEKGCSGDRHYAGGCRQDVDITKPGDQFIIRREVYRRIQERFRAEGIEFAHRNVTVYLPPDVTGAADGNNLEESAVDSGRPDKRLLEAGAAAAIAASQADASKKSPK